MTFRIEALVIQEQQLVAHVHINEDGHDVFTFDSPKLYHPGLARSINELEQAVEGAIVAKMRKLVEQHIPESREDVKLGMCKMCSAPVASNEPGIRINGPFYYCKQHANQS